MSEEEKRNGDTAIIAEGLGCSIEQVRLVLGHKRGNRPTVLQHNIRLAAAARVQQNKDFIEYCQKLQVKSVTLTPTSFQIPE